MSETVVMKRARAVSLWYWMALACWGSVPIVAAVLLGWRTPVFLFFVFLAGGWTTVPTLIAALLPLILLPFALNRHRFVSE